MIRRVAFRKAVIGGALGAVAWEVSVRMLLVLGVPMFDLVNVLGAMVIRDRSEIWLWWPIGMAMHGVVGAIWAIFYAYFFWSFYDFPPFVQGMMFSILPTFLAGLIMIPQMDYMSEPISNLRTFALGIGWLGPVSVLVGHLIYGAVLGAVYRRPVGYATGQRPEWYG